MTLAGAALRTVRRSARSYRLWFISVASSACMFYLFLAGEREPTISALLGEKATLALGMGIAAVILGIFAAVYMTYCATFFIRERAREIGLYRLFGLGRGRIALMLLAENCISGSAALALGIGAGILLSRLFLLGFSRMLDIAVDPGIVADGTAILRTVVVFTLIMGLASLAASTSVFASRLVDVFQSEKRSETEKKGGAAFGVAALLLIGSGYVFAALTDGKLLLIAMVTVSILVTAGSWAFCRGGMSLVLDMLRRRDSWYLKGPRMVALSRIAHRSGSSARISFVIAMISAVSMIALGIGINVKYSLETTLASYLPDQLTVVSRDETARAAFLAELEAARVRVTPVLSIPAISAKRLDTRMDSGFFLPSGIMVHPASAYLEIARKHSRMPAEALAALSDLPRGEAVIVEPLDEAASRYLGKDMELSFPGPASGPASGAGADVHAQAGAGNAVFMVTRRLHRPAVNTFRSKDTIIIGDEDWKAILAGSPDAPGLQVDYELSDLKTALPILERARDDRTNGLAVEARVFLRELGKSFDVYLFSGGFLGLVFLFCVCSILYFKQIMDAREDRARFATLRKIGLSERDEARIARMQVIPLYGIPLALALCHGTAALLTMGRILGEDYRLPILGTGAAFTLVFIGFAAVTIRAYRRTVSSPGG